MVLDHQKDYGSQREAIVGIGAKVSSSSRTDFVLDALEQALHARRPMQGGWIDHSDRGVQYVSIRYTQRLAEAGIEPSVGSVGDSWDNAPAETSNGLHKAEVIHRRSWKTMQEVELATLDWVDWFNHKRLLERSGTFRQRRPKRPMTGNRSRCRWRRDSRKKGNSQENRTQSERIWS